MNSEPPSREDSSGDAADARSRRRRERSPPADGSAVADAGEVSDAEAISNTAEVSESDATAATPSDGIEIGTADSGADAALAGDEAAMDAASIDDEAEGFGRKGWMLVAVVVLSTLVIPGIVYLAPRTPRLLGFDWYIAALIVFPMLPAVLLGATAVWSMTAATNGRE